MGKNAGVPVINTDLVLEGGCFETGGRGTAIMTERCILKDNRNPGKSKKEVEDRLKKYLDWTKLSG